ncbi:SdpI family protein [Tsukamurella tyrosinosolvens]
MTALVIIVLAVTAAGARGRLLPNQRVGIRTPSTVQSPEAWRAGHRAALPVYAVLVPLAACLDAAILVAVKRGVSPGAVGLLLIASSVVLVVVVVIGAVVAGRAARRAQLR